MFERWDSFDHAWLWFAMDLSVKATLLLTIASVAAAVLRSASAAFKHRLWSLTFAVLLLLPFANRWLPNWSCPILPRDWIPSVAFAQNHLPAASSAALNNNAEFEKGPQLIHGSDLVSDRAASSETVVADNRPITASVSHEVDRDQAATNTPKSPRFALQPLSAIWLIGVLVVLLPLATGILGNLYWKLRGTRLLNEQWQRLLHDLCEQLRIHRPITLLQAGPDQMPMTFGVLHAYVVLPADASNWPADRQRMVLLHELAHVKRYDVAWQMIARLGCALYWFHPLAWYAVRRMRLEREHACDDCALLAGQQASSYATQLLEIARAHRSRSPLATAALSMARQSQLEGRLLAVLDAKRSRAPLGVARSITLLVFALALIIGLGTLRPTVQAESPHADGSLGSNSDSKDSPPVLDNSQVIIAGNVVSSKEKPVAGALVEMVAMEHGDPRRMPNRHDSIPYYSTRSNEAGQFEFVVPRKLFDSPQVALYATAKGYAIVQVGLGPSLHQQRMEPKLKLPGAKTVHLQLVDSAGTPVAGIEPQLWSEWGGNDGIFLADHRAVTLLKSWPKVSPSDENGYCSFTIPEKAEELEIVVDNERFGCQKIRLKPSDEPMAVALKPGRFLNGKVVAADTGDPIPGAELMLLEEPFRRTSSDQDGNFHIAGGSRVETLFGPGESILQVYPPPDSPYLFYAQEWKWPTDGISNGQLTVRMEKGIVVEGDVLDKDSQQPIAGAVIYFEPQEYNNKNYRQTAKSRWSGSDMKYVTDDKGHFRMPVWPGPGYLLVKAPTLDYVHVMVSQGDKYYGQPGLERNYHDGALQLNLKRDETPTPLKIELQRGVTLRRKVVRPDGQPAEGFAYARSYLTDNNRMCEGGAASIPLDNGILEMPGFDPEHSNPILIVDAKQHCAAAISPEQKPDDLDSPPIQLQPTGSASFHLLTDKDKPLPNFDVRLLLIVTPGAVATHHIEPKQPLWADSIIWDNISYQFAERGAAKTDEQGNAVVKDLIPGATYRINYLDDKGGWTDGYEFKVASGEMTNVGDVVIPKHD